MTRHTIPWAVTPTPAFDDDTWELYAPDDWTQAHDIAREQPEKLRELPRLFLIEAARHAVLPLEDRRAELLIAERAGRPTLIRGRSELLFPGMGRLGENIVLNLKNKSHAVTAQLVFPESPANGTIVAQGGAFGGWSLYVKDGQLRYCYNVLGVRRYQVSAEPVLPPGAHQVRMEFVYDGGGLAKGGEVTLYLDGQPIGSGRVGMTQPLTFSVDETLDVGRECATAVAEDCTPESSTFTGTIEWVQLDQGTDDHDHLISPEERLQLVMTRQ